MRVVIITPDCNQCSSSLPGVGIGMVMVTLIVSIYYNVIIAYSLYYMFASMQSRLPWSDCLSWADSNCSKTPIGDFYLFIIIIIPCPCKE